MMKNFANLTLELLSTEELMAVQGGVKGGDVPTDPIIIHEGPTIDYLNTIDYLKIKKHSL